MNLIKKCSLSLFTFSLLISSTSVQVAKAEYRTFFGEDFVSADASAARPKSEQARKSFLSLLSSAGTEDFESFSQLQSAPLSVDFSLDTALLTGFGGALVGIGNASAIGRFATSGQNWVDTNIGPSAGMRVDFSTPQSAFGFYGTDIGDFQGQMVLNLVGGGVRSFDVPHTVNGANGSVLYYGIIGTAPEDQFNSIEFVNSGSDEDYWGFDDMTIGRLSNSIPNIPPDNDFSNGVQPLDRLARWNDGQFVEVAPDSITSGNVHVLVHGWSPGMRSWVEAHPDTLLGSFPKIWDRSAVQTASGVEENKTSPWLEEAAESIKDRDPNAVVLAYSWIDDSATQSSFALGAAAPARDKAGDQGSFLATALRNAISDSGDVGLHLLGHSHGALVSTVAAIDLGMGSSELINVDHLTIWDSPEASVPVWLAGGVNHLEQLLPTLGQRGSDAPYVDNYVSAHGTDYSASHMANGLTNVSLKAPLSYFPKGSAAHAYAVEWYQKANDSASEEIGLAWSPLLGDYYDSLEGDYIQDWETFIFGTPVQNPQKELILKPRTTTSVLTESLSLPITSLLTGGTVQPFADGSLYVENSPSFEQLVILLGDRDVALTFDYQFLEAGDGDELGIWIDGGRRYTATGAIVGTELRHGVIDISDFDAGEHFLTVVLHSIGDANSQVYVGNYVAISVVPEPASFTLLVIGILGLTGYGRHRRKR